MALFRFDLQGIPEPVNATARLITQQAQSVVGAPAVAAAAPVNSRTAADRLLARTLTAQQVMMAVASKVGRREQVVNQYDLWLPLELIRLDYAVRHRFGRTRTHADLLIYESLDGSRWTPPKKQWNPAAGTPDAQVVPARVRGADIAKQGNQLWQKLRQLKQAAAIERTWAELTNRGAPDEAVSGSFHDGGEVLLPVHLAIAKNAKGTRIVAVDAHAGNVNEQLSLAATQHAGWLRTSLVES